VLGAALCGPLALRAQNPDSIPPDTILTDSLRRSPDQTRKLLDGDSLALVRVPVLPRLGGAGPAPALSRIVLDRDSIDWHNAETLGDLLQAQPGVYLWRAGWIGQAEAPDYQGRGAASIRYYLDGIPFLPLGPDSAAVDPALFPLNLLQRVEIERWPGQLVVRLYTRQHDRLAPRSRILVAAGDRKFARFGGDLERQYASGIGFALAGEYLDAPARSGEGTDVNTFAVLARGSYVPTPRWGAQYQVFAMFPDRSTWQLTAGSDSLGRSLNGTRTDAYFRGFFRSGTEGHDAQFDLIAGSSHWNGDSVTQTVGLIGATGALRRPTWRVGAEATSWSRWTPFDARVDGGWTPLPGLAVSGVAVHQRHDGDRTSDWLGVQAGLTLPFRLQVNASARLGSEVAVPSIATETAQDLRDWRVAAGWERALAGAEVAWAHTAAFRPVGYEPYIQVPALAPLGAVDWLEVSARLSPRQWLLFEARYGDPQRVTVDGVPPTHSIITGTIRSKFLRQYRSGIFDLKLQLAMESWGRGIIGRDSTGAAVTLPGATFFRGQVQFQLGSLILYYDRFNLRNTLLGYVPGFVIPAGGQTFGVRWEFTN
jgi:hypothetical protein